MLRIFTEHYVQGGTLCPVDNNFSKIFPGRFIKNKKINFLVCVPSLIDIIRNSNDLNKKNLKLLKRIFFCGEPLLKSQVRDIFKAKKSLEIINAYGPTEATVSCTYKKITQKNLIKKYWSKYINRKNNKRNED